MPEQHNVFATELKNLEERMLTKMKQMAEAGIERPEAEVFKEVLEEHTGHAPVETPVQPHAVSTPSSTEPATRQTTEEEEARLTMLVEHAFNKGIISAVNEAKSTNSPYFIDLLHDRLADEYYQKLVAAKKINPN